MSNAAQHVRNLVQGLMDDRQRYLTLHSLLEEQREHIIARQPGSLDAVNARIMDLYQQLTQSSRQRNQTLTSLGIQSTSHGMQMLLARLPATPKQQIGTLWRTLQQQASACQQANSYNGTLINMQQEILTNLLNAAEPENWLYQNA